MPKPLTDTMLNAMLFGRERMVHFTKADERRIHAYIERFNADPVNADEPLNFNTEFSTIVGAIIDRGLDESERDAHVQAYIDGSLFPRSKTRLKHRIKYAYMELKGYHGR